MYKSYHAAWCNAGLTYTYMKKQPILTTITNLRATYTNDFRAFTKVAHKYAGKTDPFLRWKLENLDDDSICRALYDLDEEMYYYEEDHGYRPEKPLESAMLKREFLKRFGKRWDETHVDFEDICYSSYCSINTYTTREIKIIEDEHGIYDSYSGNDDDYSF
jgi:hypothetical protein